ncbi:MAG: isochorismatase family protein [Caldilineaceae bacterium]
MDWPNFLSNKYMHHFTFTLQHQALGADANGWSGGKCVTTRAPWRRRVAIIICDMWDNHWSSGAAERVNIMAPRMNQVLHAARNHGAHILHAPSETMPFYANSAARQRMLDLPAVQLPAAKEHPAPPLPIDASDHGSDTGETSTFKAWSRQHSALDIDEARDGISDNGEEIYRYLQQQQIEQVLIMGVHTNMCVLNRSFAIKQMVRWGVPIALVRDLTDAMYNPAMAPYVSHDDGVQLVIGYIEKFWCPTIESGQLYLALS